MPPKKQVPAQDTAGGDASVPSDASAADQAVVGAEQAASNDATPSAATNGTPAPTQTATRSSSATSRGGKSAVAPKPKFAGRRSQAARRELEQAEARKKAAEAEAAAAEARNKAREERRFGYGRGRGRGDVRGGRGGRGRGGYNTDQQRQRDEPIPSGPFGSGQVNADGSRKTGWSSGGGGVREASGAFGGGYVVGSGGGSGGSRPGGGTRSHGAGGTSSIKQEPGVGDIAMGGMDMRPIKPEDGGYISSDEDEGTDQGPKQNIDQMQVIDLIGDDVEPGMDFAPVRLQRVPHKERLVGLSVDDDTFGDSSEADETAVSEKKKGKQKVKDSGVTGMNERPRRPTVYSSSDTEPELVSKGELAEDDHEDRPGTPTGGIADEQTTSGAVHDPPSSPDTRRKAKEKIKATADLLADSDDYVWPPQPKFQTQAELEEWNRKCQDLKDLRLELGSLGPSTATQTTDPDGDTAMAERLPQTAAARRQASREEHVYVFQFPPVLPDLVPVRIKDDPDNIRVSNPNDVPMDVDEPAEEPEVKKPALGSLPQPKLPSGAVGKLRIHKSGKATLDWGGTSLLVGRGADATFLQTIMLAKIPETKPKDDKKPADATTAAEQEQEPALGMGMGQIRRKFVLTPDWDELLR